MKRYLIILFCCSLFACNTDKFDSEVTLPIIFENGMVLQRNQKVHVWGKGIPNKKVRVSIAGLMGSTEVAIDSTWSLKLPEAKAGGPFVLQVNNQEIEDVYIGDVWLAGGQSNMEWALKSDVIGAEKEFSEGGNPEIRFFKVPHSYSAMPQEDLQGGEWKVANKENLPDFSAVAWFFAKRNHLEKDVPVGIIESNWGGTPAEGWTDASVLASMDASYSAEAKEIIDQAEEWEKKVLENEKNSDLRNKLVTGPDSLQALQVASIDYDDSGWGTINLPKSNPMQDIAWIRKGFKLATAQEAVLHLSNIDQMAYIYLNGNLLHYKDWGVPVPEIDIPASWLNEGTNVLTIRAINTWNNQPRVGESGEMYILQGSNKISLEGNWAYSTNIVEPQLPKVEKVNWKPGMMYNSMINPLVSYPIKGVIWYQGESNAGRADEYEELFSAMITNWRSKWGLGDIPFLFVQLANFMERKSPQPESDWAYLREAQSKTLSLPNTGMAVIIDIGEAGDIHPKNKKDVGERLWLQAKKIAYNEDIVANGPVFKSASIQEGKIVVTFEDVAGGLEISDGDNSVKGFIVETSSGRFQEVSGEISGVNEVVLNLDVTNPVEIRYAWADNPEVNLVNALGLPTAPFRYSFESN
ncbi:sialate O-acetylesterase [Algoriphagus machipongonensis]|uniref:Sialate O-acetylesterase n=1 Tax=Algoriphagus machipongonensis TaxID=388413 RepID=A3HTJ4_9BACT|nr:sialate O-acetylesterase [Algoriphagus machipongonensis]EAZ83162.1 putative sialate O-acetylesterase [Algoriphagus machipongonensis]